MPNPVERTVMRHLKTTTTLAAAVAALTLTATSCSSDPAEGTTSTSTSAAPSSSTPSQSETTYDDEHAFTEAEKVAKRAVARDRNEAIPKDADWATAAYKKDRADVLENSKAQGITIKGTTTWGGFKRNKSNPDAPGGWDLTGYVCTTSDTRAYKNGKDVSLGADGKPLPKGKRDVVYLYSFTTPDKGETWQVHDAQQVEDESCDD